MPEQTGRSHLRDLLMAKEQELKGSLKLYYLPSKTKQKKPMSMSPAQSIPQYKTRTAWQIQYLQTIPTTSTSAAGFNSLCSRQSSIKQKQGTVFSLYIGRNCSHSHMHILMYKMHIQLTLHASMCSEAVEQWRRSVFTLEVFSKPNCRLS